MANEWAALKNYALKEFKYQQHKILRSPTFKTQAAKVPSVRMKDVSRSQDGLCAGFTMAFISDWFGGNFLAPFNPINPYRTEDGAKLEVKRDNEHAVSIFAKTVGDLPFNTSLAPTFNLKVVRTHKMQWALLPKFFEQMANDGKTSAVVLGVDHSVNTSHMVGVVKNAEGMKFFDAVVGGYSLIKGSEEKFASTWAAIHSRVMGADCRGISMTWVAPLAQTAPKAATP